MNHLVLITLGSKMKLLHLSDLHYRQGWHEEQGVLLDALFVDLADNLVVDSETYLIFSGDIVQSGSDKNQYIEFQQKFMERIWSLGFGRENTFFVPGNHDVDQKYVAQKIQSLDGIRNQELSELSVNELLENETDLFASKFENFDEFSKKNSKSQYNDTSPFGSGHSISSDHGMFLLNTATFSFGGAKRFNGDPIDDLGNLCVPTRELSRWISSSEHEFKILVMHHPLDWLNESMQSRLRNLINSNFDLVLHGHIHEQNTTSFHSTSNNALILSSPPLFTRLSGNLGYSFIKIDDQGSKTIIYRAWSGKSKFVKGVAITENDTGTIHFDNGRRQVVLTDAAQTNDFSNDAVGAILGQNFEKVIGRLQSKTDFLIVPCVSDIPENSSDSQKTSPIEVDMFVEGITDTVLRAPPQFGLSVLGAYIAKKYWNYVAFKKLPVFVDSGALPNHENGIREYIERLPEFVLSSTKSIGLIVVDNWDEENQLKIRQANAIKKSYPSAAIVLLSRRENHQIGSDTEIGSLNFEYDLKYLWSLDRSKVRKIIQKFNSCNGNLDEDQALDLVISHLSTLNIHRTPHNVVTLLTIIASQVDAGPVNRMEMIEKFLYICFSNVSSTPRYSTVPDLKDSLYVIGYFVENLYEENSFYFSKQDFLKYANEYCQKQFLTIEVDVLFSCLIETNILTFFNGLYRFQFSYWLHFFAAHRMHQSRPFYEKIMNASNYARFPEIVEFYSGIDRRATDLLEYLSDDLRTENLSYERRSDININFDPADILSWEPDEENVKEAQTLINNEVENSNIPVEIKDAIADSNFDRRLPYNQQIKSYFKESSLLLCREKMWASSRALRNSDHADVEKRKALFSQIMSTISNISQLIAIASPVFAKLREFEFEGISYYLTESFEGYKNDGDRAIAIISTIPHNMGRRFIDDIYSPKLIPLFENFINDNKNEMVNVLLIKIIIERKPKDWAKIVKNYVNRLDKNSFYLGMVSSILMNNYSFGFNDSAKSKELRDLAGYVYGRHYTGAKRPNKKTIAKYSNIIKNTKDNNIDTTD